MPCPLLRDGLCYSPRRSAVAPPEDSSLCKKSTHELSRCPHYDREAAFTMERLLSPGGRRGPVLPYVHLFNRPLKSSCERYMVVPLGAGFAAYCMVLTRYLTVYEAEVCEKNYQTCPLRRRALQP